MGVTACHVCSTGSSPQARSTLTCLIQEQLLRVRDLSNAAAAISKSNQSPKSVPVGMQPGPAQPHSRAMSAAVRTSLCIPAAHGRLLQSQSAAAVQSTHSAIELRSDFSAERVCLGFKGWLVQDAGQRICLIKSSACLPHSLRSAARPTRPRYRGASLHCSAWDPTYRASPKPRSAITATVWALRFLQAREAPATVQSVLLPVCTACAGATCCGCAFKSRCAPTIRRTCAYAVYAGSAAHRIAEDGATLATPVFAKAGMSMGMHSLALLALS